jgi:hypothetical protein
MATAKTEKTISGETGTFETTPALGFGFCALFGCTSLGGFGMAFSLLFTNGLAFSFCVIKF